MEIEYVILKDYAKSLINCIDILEREVINTNINNVDRSKCDIEDIIQDMTSFINANITTI